MKNLRKLVIASFMLVIAFVAVVSSTYAWFTQSSEGKVTDITIGVVDANKSLLIAKDATNVDDLVWSKNLSYDFAEDKYTPVTISTSNGTFQKFYELRTDDDLYAYYVDATELAEKPAGENVANTLETGYVKLDLVFQVQAAETLDGTKIFVDIINLHAFIKGTDLNVANDASPATEENEFAASAFRMAFVDKAAAVQQIIEGPNTTNANGHYGNGIQFLATNAWMQRYAQNGATHNYHNGNTAITGIDDANKGLFVEQASTGSVWTLKADHKDAIYNTGEGSKVKAYNNASYDSNVTDESAIAANEAKAEYVISQFYKEPTCTTAVASTDTTGYAKITVYVWMEGWDGDCENVASGAIYRFGLQFQVK